MCEANQFAEGKLVTSAGRLKKMAELNGIGWKNEQLETTSQIVELLISLPSLFVFLFTPLANELAEIHTIRPIARKNARKNHINFNSNVPNPNETAFFHRICPGIAQIR